PSLTRYGFDRTRRIARCKGSALEHLLLKHPFEERRVPLICGEHVTLEAGTGLVHTAPAHGLDDYTVGAKYGLPVDNPVGDDGKFFASVANVGGLSVWKANPFIVDLLRQKALLLSQARLTHPYPHCWRHKTPLIFRATQQWFIGMERNGPPPERSLRDTALAAVEQTDFYPSWGKARLHGMIAKRPDWCLSRQRNWGVPMPFFLERESGELHPRTQEFLEQVARHVEKQGIDAWFSLDTKQLLGNEENRYRKSSDTLDVWFDSGTTHDTVLTHHAQLRRPADLYLEGSDQHRGWFQSSLLTGCSIDGAAPYRELLTHGFVVDGQGHKMSKSKGNVIAPQKVAGTLGADILRLWVASTDYSGELSISDEILKRVVESYRRIRNTLRFLLANLADFDPQQHTLMVDQWLEIDRYAVARLSGLQGEMGHDKSASDAAGLGLLHAYHTYQFHVVAQELHNYCSEELGGFYLDILKDRLYTAGTDSPPRRSAQNALFHIAQGVIKLMTPILSFTAQEAWTCLPGDKSEYVFTEHWHRFPEIPEADDLLVRWESVKKFRSRVQKLLEEQRVAGNIGSSLAADVDIHTQVPELSETLQSFGDDLRFILITSQARVYKASTGAGEDGLDIRVAPSPHPKCERCWHYRADVGSDPAHPEICGRCVANLFGAGEMRRYA
ncbi:MAG: isoleucine--tRNA ligase, partial [Burkholderiales bacterium]